MFLWRNKVSSNILVETDALSGAMNLYPKYSDMGVVGLCKGVSCHWGVQLLTVGQGLLSL